MSTQKMRFFCVFLSDIYIVWKQNKIYIIIISFYQWIEIKKTKQTLNFMWWYILVKCNWYIHIIELYVSYMHFWKILKNTKNNWILGNCIYWGNVIHLFPVRIKMSCLMRFWNVGKYYKNRDCTFGVSKTKNRFLEQVKRTTLQKWCAFVLTYDHPL